MDFHYYFVDFYVLVDISVGLSKNDPMYNQKKAYLDKSGRGASSVRFPLQGDRYPSELVDFLRLLLVEPEDLGMQSIDRVDFNEPLSPSLERRVLSTMISICESYLEQYPTTIEEDEKLIVDKSLFGVFTRQQRMAIKLRISEKRILKQTIVAVTEELNRLPAVVVGDQIVPAGRSFDTLMSSKSKSTQANSALAWVEIRGEKEKQAAAAAAAAAAASSASSTSKENPNDTEKLSIAERRRRRRG